MYELVPLRVGPGCTCVAGGRGGAGRGAALGQGLVLRDAGRRGAAGRAARVAQGFVEALRGIRPGRHFALKYYTSRSEQFYPLVSIPKYRQVCC